MEVDYEKLGKQIRKWRELKGLTQQQLSEKSDLSNTYLCQIENNYKKASLAAVLSIAKALDITLDDLLTGNQVATTTDYRNEMDLILRGCSEREKELVCDLTRLILRAIRKEQNNWKSF